MFFNYKPNEVKKPPTVYIVQFRYFFSLSKETTSSSLRARHATYGNFNEHSICFVRAKMSLNNSI